MTQLDEHFGIDVHAHVGFTIANDLGQTVETLRNRLEEEPGSQALPSPAAAGAQANGLVDTQRNNDLVADAVRDDPTLFPGGFGLVEFRHGASVVAETIRIVDQLGLLGIAMHPKLEGYNLDTAVLLDDVFDVLDERSAICLLHYSPEPDSGEGTSGIRRLLSRHSRTTVILGHPFLSSAQESEAIEIWRDFPNAYFDTAYQSSAELLVRLVGGIGSERLVFGTDQPFYDAADVYNSIVQADISEIDKTNILRSNMLRLFSAREERLSS